MSSTATAPVIASAPDNGFVDSGSSPPLASMSMASATIESATEPTPVPTIAPVPSTAPDILQGIEEQAILAAYQQTETRGLEFGRLCYDYRAKHSAQGSRTGDGLAQVLRKLGIKEGRAYYWIARHEESIGIREERWKIRDTDLFIKEVSLETAAEFVAAHHYSTVMPQLNKVVIGLFKGQEEALVGVITFGWGVQPEQTIKKLFPSLTTEDYFEIGKMCLLDEMPKNSESQFISTALSWLRKKHPAVKLVFTWADAMWGKPGYIYQASNFLYGGFIQTEVYQDAEGKRVHPRQLLSLMRSLGTAAADVNWVETDGVVKVARPSEEQMQALGIKQFFGKQFRYVRFLCDKAEQKRLLAESPFPWNTDYPKDEDMDWQVRDGSGEGRKACEQPAFTGTFDCAKVKSAASTVPAEFAGQPVAEELATLFSPVESPATPVKATEPEVLPPDSDTKRLRQLFKGTKIEVKQSTQGNKFDLCGLTMAQCREVATLLGSD